MEFLQQGDCLIYTLGIDVFKTFHGAPPPSDWVACKILSGVMGSSLIRFPVALKIALAMVATEAVMGGSPTTFPPKGPKGSGCSMKITSTSGVSRWVGTLASR